MKLITRSLTAFISVMLLVCFENATAQTITLKSELRNLYDISLLPAYRTGSIPGQESSYDRKWGNNDGFDGAYSFVRRNADSSLVMLDIDGPGVLNRIATPTPTSDTLDFYVDFARKPTLSICYNDLFSGKVYPFIRPFCDNAVGGYFCYFPILFQQHLTIVCRGHHLQFHQLQYRLFPKGTKVASFAPEQLKKLPSFRSAWQQPIFNDKTERLKQTIAPGATATLNLDQGGRINALLLDTGATANLSLRITWDNSARPTIDCPVRDLFGYAFGEAAMQGLLAGQKGGRYYCYLPMPFDKSASISLLNNGTTPVPVNLTVTVNTVKRNPGREGKLYVNYVNHHLTEKDPFHVFLNIKGKGHYVGTILMAKGNFNGMPGFFEGDDTTATDGKFRIHGTGSEDYLNGGWYAVKGRWEHAESRALSGCLGYSDSPAATGGFRFYMNDKLSFETDIFQAIEHGGDRHGLPADYTSVSFYYCDKGKEEQ
jgi:hypothetical protein